MDAEGQGMTGIGAHETQLTKNQLKHLKKKKRKLFLHVTECGCASVVVHTCAPCGGTCGGQRTTLWSWFSPSIFV